MLYCVIYHNFAQNNSVYTFYLITMTLLQTSMLQIGYEHRQQKVVVQSDLNLSFSSGELICLIGPNGSGKSTLLRTISGLQPALSGKILIEGVPLHSLSNSRRAQLISLVLTDRVEIENATVRALVSMGRMPYSNWWGSLSADDEQRVNEAIELVHLKHKRNALLSELSDGERQRVMIAKAFVQDTPVVMLDEPTAHLDLPNRVEIMLLLHQLAHQTGKAIVLSTHELDMALQAADRIWLMTEGEGVRIGVPEDLVLNGSFSDAFLSDKYVFNPANGNFSMNYVLDKQVSLKGDKTRMYWTLRALARAGFAAVASAEKEITIHEDHWVLEEQRIDSIEALLSRLNKKVKP